MYAHPCMLFSLCALQSVFTCVGVCARVCTLCVILPEGGFKTHYVRYWMATV